MVARPEIASNEGSDERPAKRRCVVKLDSRFGADVGGTLAKIVCVDAQSVDAEDQKWQVRKSSWLKSLEDKACKDTNLSFHSAELGGLVRFMRLPTRCMETCSEDIENVEPNVDGNDSKQSETIVVAGGFAKKLQDLFISKGVTVRSQCEISALVRGLCFCAREVPDQCFVLRPGVGDKLSSDRWLNATREPIAGGGLNFPFLICNIGTGVSLVKVEGENKFSRVGGTALGGGTFLGLCRLVTGVESFDEALELAEGGDERKANMTVGDIVGGDNLRLLGLPQDATASFFAKTATESCIFAKPP
jgi:type II pantothenate kinase